MFALTACGGGSDSVTTTDANGQTVVIAFTAGTEKITVTLPAATFADISLTNFVPLANVPAGTTYEVLGLPAGVTFDAATNTLKVSQTVAPGTYTVTERVTVNAGTANAKSDARTITLVVVAATPAPTPAPTPTPTPAPAPVAASAILGDITRYSFTQGGDLFCATVVPNLSCVATVACTLSISADGLETNLGSDGQPIFQLYQLGTNQYMVIFTNNPDTVSTGVKKFTVLATTLGGVVVKRVFKGVRVEAAAAPTPSPAPAPACTDPLLCPSPAFVISFRTIVR